MSERDREQLNQADAAAEVITLESILSEYKAEAFVKNERRLSKEELEARTEAIIREMKESLEAEERAANAQQSAPESEETASEQEESPVLLPPEEGREEAPAAEAAAETAAPQAETVPAEAEDTEAAGEAEAPATVEEAQAEEASEEAESEAVAEEAGVEAEEPFLNPILETAPQGVDAHTVSGKSSRRMRRREARRLRARQKAAEKAAGAEAEAQAAPEPAPELTAPEAARLYSSGIASLRRRTLLAFAFSILMALIVLIGEKGGALPGFLRNPNGRCAALVIGQLAVMLLGADILMKGVLGLFSGQAGADTLAAVANLCCLVDGLLIFLGKRPARGGPYACVAAMVLAFNMLGERMGRSAFRDILRTMKGARIPTVVTAEEDLADEGLVLCKRLGSARGFLSKCIEPDLASRRYHILAPALLVLAAVLALFAVMLSGEKVFFHTLAALTVAAASMTSALVYRRPFMFIARRLAASGAVLAGWSGAEDVYRSVGMVVRDLDLFPEHTIQLNGMKVLSGAPVEKVISYAGSMIQASNSGLKRSFGELMRQYAVPTYHTEEFNCSTEGGISAFIGQDLVMLGSAAYMNLMGIRVPGTGDVAGAVYIAVNRELSGIFIVNYTPVDMVQNALINLLRSKVRPIFAVRDFNVNPAMLKTKFKLGSREIRFLPMEDRYQLSVDSESEAVPTALMTREGLGHYVEIARSGRRLVRAVRRGLRFTVLGSLVGMLLIFLACARGAFMAASAGNLLLFMLLWALAVILIADGAEGD